VITVELQMADVPSSNYNINEYNNVFYFQDSEEQLRATCGRPYHKIQIPIGNYPIADPCLDSIKSLLEQGLNAVDPANKYKITYDKNQGTITIMQTEGSGVFNILFQYPQCCRTEVKPSNTSNNSSNYMFPNNMGDVLGFKTDTNKTGHTSYTGEYMTDIRSDRYIILKVNAKDKNWGRIDSNHDPAQDALCVLTLDTRENNFHRMDNCDQIGSEKYKLSFNPPLPKMDRLNIEFLDPKGNAYNFRGRNNLLLFEITSLSRFSEYHEGSNQVNKVSI
jgi:hypothetical protein